MSEGEAPDDSQKTEDPTQKRLEEARRKGQVAVSRELNNWIMLLAGTILIGTAASPMMSHMQAHLKTYLEKAWDFPQTPGGLSIVLGDSFKIVLGMLLLPFLVLMAAAFIGPFIQVGPIFAPDVIKPDLGKISPFSGFQRLFSKRALMEFAKGLLKMGLISTVGFIILKPYFAGLEHMVGLPVPLLLDEMQAMVIKLLIGVLVVLVVLAVIDTLYQRTEHYKKMRMTKQELKDEHKQMEGDPHIKARLRQLRTERARARMMQAVPRADVVITNPTHYSVALKYDPEEMEAPMCIAKGIDDLALRIRETAKKHDVVIYENPPLARVLYSTVEIDEAVPPEHYKAVAEVISYVFKLKGRLN